MLPWTVHWHFMILPVLLERYLTEQKAAPIKDKCFLPAEEKKNIGWLNSEE